MSHTEGMATQSLSGLVRHCAEQTELFFRKQPHSTAACFELFRRAIVERDQAAWTAIYEQYKHQVLGWTLRHSQFEHTGEDASFFVNRAFERFWQGLKPDHFANYHDLAALLGYLQMCVHSSIISMMRTSEAHLKKTPLDTGTDTISGPDPEDEALGRAGAAEIWSLIRQTCQTEAELTVAYATYALGMAPRQICARYPGLFTETKQIADIKRRLETRLARHPSICALMDAKNGQSRV